MPSRLNPLMLSLLVAPVMGCTPGPERDAREATTRYLEAWRFKDVQALYDAHAESSARGTYCTSSAFATLHDRVKRTSSPQACAEARAAGTDPKELDPETALLLQVVRFVCEEPEGTCRDYQRRVFDAALDASPAWSGALERAEVDSVDATESTARARVVLHHTCCEAPTRTTLTLERAPTGWRVAGPPLPSLPSTRQEP